MWGVDIFPECLHTRCKSPAIQTAEGMGLSVVTWLKDSSPAFVYWSFGTRLRALLLKSLSKFGSQF